MLIEFVCNTFAVRVSAIIPAARTTWYIFSLNLFFTTHIPQAISSAIVYSEIPLTYNFISGLHGRKNSSTGNTLFSMPAHTVKSRNTDKLAAITTVLPLIWATQISAATAAQQISIVFALA